MTPTPGVRSTRRRLTKPPSVERRQWLHSSLTSGVLPENRSPLGIGFARNFNAPLMLRAVIPAARRFGRGLPGSACRRSGRPFPDVQESRWIERWQSLNERAVR